MMENWRFTIQFGFACHLDLVASSYFSCDAPMEVTNSEGQKHIETDTHINWSIADVYPLPH
jgi:hypothetical protein